jgi:hypothetical protein
MSFGLHRANIGRLYSHIIIRGVRNRKNSRIVIHQSQRPPFSADIDYNTLGLNIPIKHNLEHVIPRTAWSPAPKTSPDLPFIVERTTSSSLPVYTDYKHGRTKVITILRKCSGDIETLKSEMEKVVGAKVDVKPGKLVVDGNYVLRVKTWLTGLGF